MARNNSISQKSPFCRRLAKASYIAASLAITLANPFAINPASASGSGLDLNAYCRSIYGQPGASVWATLTGNRGVYDWKCVRKLIFTTYYGINIGHACAVQRGTWSHHHHGTADSWHCGR